MVLLVGELLLFWFISGCCGFVLGLGLFYLVLVDFLVLVAVSVVAATDFVVSSGCVCGLDSICAWFGVGLLVCTLGCGIECGLRVVVSGVDSVAS